MSGPSDVLVEEVRDWTGTLPDTATIYDALNRHGDHPHRAALTILRRRYADMVANPAKWAVVDDYSQDVTENLKLLRNQISSLEGLVDDHTAHDRLRSTPIDGPDLTIR